MNTSSQEFTNHISQRFNEELENLRTVFLSMGGLVEKQIIDALHALLDGDMMLANEVMLKDTEVNSYENRLDESIEKILSRRQPAAIDLRLVLMLSKSITDLERMGDEAVRIAKYAKFLFENTHSERGYREVRNIGSQIRVMIHDVLDAFARLDAEQAFGVMQHDVSIDEEYLHALQSLIGYAAEHGAEAENILHTIWILRAIERIGDHASNIAEQIIYVISGNDVRHTRMEEVEKRLMSLGNLQNDSK